jgi:hypothetical protein
MSPLRNSPELLPTPRHTLRSTVRSPFRVLALALGAVGMVTACADTPSAPAGSQAPAAPARNLVGTALGALGETVNTLTWSRPARPETVGRVIGREGGSFSLSNGMRVTVPAGAVQTPVTFSVTRLPGLIVAYDFQPHGTTFAVPVRIDHPTRDLNLTPLQQASWIQGAYFAGDDALNQTSGTAQVTEFRPTLVEADKKSVSFTVDHFSGYTVAWGRTQ